MIGREKPTRRAVFLMWVGALNASCWIAAPAVAQSLNYKSMQSSELEGYCESGNAAACFYLARNYYYGDRGPQDRTRSAQLYIRACEYGNDTACADHDYIFGGTNGARARTARVSAATAARDRGDASQSNFYGFPRATDRQKQLLSDAILSDSVSWHANTYDKGSLSKVRVTGNGLVRGDYTYNGGYHRGWVEGRIRAGRIECLTYHDTGVCAPVRTATAKSLTFSSIGERPEIAWGQWAPERNIPCISTRHRTIIQNTIVYNQQRNIKTGLVGGGQQATISYSETEFANTCASTIRFRMGCPKVGLLGDTLVTREDVLAPRQRFRIFPGGCTYLEEIR